MEQAKDGFVLTTDRLKMDLDRIHAFLSSEAYWCIGIPKRVVQKAIESSLCFGVFHPSEGQVGFARVVTDHATFAWICDVYIEREFRGRGLSKWLMSGVMGELLPLNLRRICLATKDAHGLYEQNGLQVTPTPQNWMERKDNDFYLRLARES